MRKIFCSSRRDIRALKKLKSPMPSAALRECVPLSDLTELLLCAYDRVARLAYEKFWDHGAQTGSELAAWLSADREILGQMQVDVAESDGVVTALASLPGYRSAEVALGIEPRYLLIFGCHEFEDRADEAALARSLDPLRSPRRIDEDSPAIMCAHASRESFPARSANINCPASHVFCMLDLPAEVDPKRCAAILSNGLLGIHMSKVVAKSEVEFSARTE